MKKIIHGFWALIILSAVSSCIKEKYTQPTALQGQGQDPVGIAANNSIASLYTLYKTHQPSGTGAYQITGNEIIEGVVVGDDKSGNIYKELAIEDSTAGIMLMLDQGYLYPQYPVGRRLFVNLKGLCLTTYSGLLNIAAYQDPITQKAFGIPQSLIPQYVYPGKWGIYVAPKVVPVYKLNPLNPAYLSQLVQLDSVEFFSSYVGQPYANTLAAQNGELEIQDCNVINTSYLTIYTSYYSNFANSLSPSGNGTIIGIYGVYTNAAGTTISPQLTVRDTSDVQLYGARLCP